MSAACPTWSRSPLSADDLLRLDAVKWWRVTRELAQAVAEGWNAGLTTKEMAMATGYSPGSFRILLGRLTQIGVSLRGAGQKVAADVVTVDEPIPVKSETPRLALRKFSWEVE